jgi:hypothetical protein
MHFSTDFFLLPAGRDDLAARLLIQQTGSWQDAGRTIH